jgi:hypothetical protein
LSDQDAANAVAGVFGAIFFVYMVILLIVVVSAWVIFTKAGKPGWAAIIPIYNIIVLLEIVGRPIWWVVLLFIPFVNFIVGIVLDIDLAKSFKKDTLFAVGLIFLPFVFMPILAFGDSKYAGPAVAQA